MHILLFSYSGKTDQTGLGFGIGRIGLFEHSITRLRMVAFLVAPFVCRSRNCMGCREQCHHTNMYILLVIVAYQSRRWKRKSPSPCLVRSWRVTLTRTVLCRKWNGLGIAELMGNSSTSTCREVQTKPFVV